MFECTEQQKELQLGVRHWADALRFDDDCDHTSESFTQRWKIIKQMGILGLPIDTSNGGLGQDILTTMLVLEEFGRICRDGGLAFSTSSHIVSTAIPIQRFGNATQKADYLERLSSGDLIGAHAITEPESGSDAWKMRTTAADNGDHYLLNGNKTFITNGPIADIFIVYAQTDPNKGTLGGHSAFIVDVNKTEGFHAGRAIKKMGLEGSPLSELYFDNCKIPKENLLGKAGAGFSMFNYVMKWEVLLSFIINVGEMQHLIERCIEYSKTRKQFGNAIGNYQAVSHKIADMKIALETAKTMLYRAATKFVQGRNVSSDLAIAKVVASEGFLQCSLNAMQIFGGIGYMKEMGIEKYVRNSVAGKIYSGSSEIQRNTIASMLGL